MYPAPGRQPTVRAGKLSSSLQTNSILHHLMTLRANTALPFLISTKTKNVLSVYMTACQLNSSYIINNLSSPTIYLPHDVPAFFHSTQVVCMLSMPYALFLYRTLKTKPLRRRNTVRACSHTRQAFQPTLWQGGKSSSRTCLFNSLSLPSWTFSGPYPPPFFPAYPHKG